MKRSAIWFVLVLLLHLSLIAAVVSQATEPQATAVEKVIEGVIIPAAVAPQREKPKPKAVQPEPVKKTKPKPLKQKKAETKKSVAKAKAAAVKAAPVAEASPKAVSTAEAVPDLATTNRVTKASEAEPQASPAVASANKAVNKAPFYPVLSRRLKEQGTVYLQVLVLKNGKVGQLNIKQSSGFARLDQSALNAVRGWTYKPALKLGQPVDFWFVQPVVFNLNSIQ